MSRKRKKRGQKRPPPPRPAAKQKRSQAASRAAAAAGERPPAPWGSFPLVELVVLVALVLLVAGFFFVGGEQGAVMIGVGVALGALAGLELSIREHFGGYRSHILLLAGFAAAIVLAALFYLGPDALPTAGRVAIAGAVFAGSAWALTADFRRRAGVAFKLR